MLTLVNIVSISFTTVKFLFPPFLLNYLELLQFCFTIFISEGMPDVPLPTCNKLKKMTLVPYISGPHL